MVVLSIPPSECSYFAC